MKSQKYVFIIGQSRSGSKFYMQYLNSLERVYVAPEQVLKYPFKRDQAEIIHRISTSDPYNFKAIVNGCYSSALKNTITEFYDEIGIEELVNFLERRGEPINNPYILLRAMLDLKAQQSNCTVVGVKFPVHSSYAYQLLHAFPEAYFLFLGRDPRSIMISDLVKKRFRMERGASAFPLRGAFLRPGVLFFTIIEFFLLTRSFERLATDKRQWFEYADVVERPHVVQERITDFIEISRFSGKSVPVVDSSFGAIEVNRKSELFWWEHFFFKVLVGRRIKRHISC